MTNKEIYREAIFVTISYIVSTVMFSILTSSKQAYISEIFIGFRKTERSWQDFIYNINFYYGLLFFFPTLFTVNASRQLYYKMRLRYLNIFQLFVSVISIIITILLLTFLKQFSDLIYGGVTIYPPLSGAPEFNNSPVFSKLWIFGMLIFCLFQIIILVITAIRIFTMREEHDMHN